ncbi:MAG: glycerate kinase [Synergistetes bacterium]|nr:glycerate kinase [Synergistota bacterium]
MNNRDIIKDIIGEALLKVRGDNIVKEHLKVEKNTLYIDKYRFPISENIHLLAIGKAACSMAKGAEDMLKGYLRDGIVVTKYGFSLPLQKCKVIEAGHPIPDQNGLEASKAVYNFAKSIPPEDTLLVLISGGGSALLPAPDNITLKDKMLVTELLLKSGATIQEINSVRKHLSFLKGGKLAQIAHPATVITIILSDVIGNEISSIASGPTVTDPSSFEDAISTLKRYNLWEVVPNSVKEHLLRGKRGLIPETPKPGDKSFQKDLIKIVADNRYFCREILKSAQRHGIENGIHLTSFVEGEAKEVAKVIAAIIKEELLSNTRKTEMIVIGGETTVTVKGNGKGGRAQELALSLAISMDRWKGFTAVSLASDGNDGITEAAGAIVNEKTLKLAKEKDLNPLSYLSNNDSFSFFNKIDSLVITGPTHTNVNDVIVILIDKEYQPTP